MSDINQVPKNCAKCDMEKYMFLAFFGNFMLSEAWDVEKLKRKCYRLFQ